MCLLEGALCGCERVRTGGTSAEARTAVSSLHSCPDESKGLGPGCKGQGRTRGQSRVHPKVHDVMRSVHRRKDKGAATGPFSLGQEGHSELGGLGRQQGDRVAGAGRGAERLSDVLTLRPRTRSAGVHRGERASQAGPSPLWPCTPELAPASATLQTGPCMALQSGDPGHQHQHRHQRADGVHSRQGPGLGLRAARGTQRPMPTQHQGRAALPRPSLLWASQAHVDLANVAIHNFLRWAACRRRDTMTWRLTGEADS